ncbi:hypothetical protein CDL15_Pgr017478 [Punica granatum]|uniref:Uncharacterized protein n=1 Tax=Punica granatum TaxID=22663 RepID=A0A218VWW0_PUNGR|nr:hypothetical protein CDL15_Pgr017478 [Punica granatum]
MDSASGHSTSSYGEVKTAGGLPAKVGTTRPRKWARLAYRAGWVVGMDSASGHSTSRYGEVKTASGLPAKVGTTRLSCGVGGRDGLGFWS